MTTRTSRQETTRARDDSRQTCECSRQVFRSILSCKKKIGLYPRGHPRVAAALRAIRQLLERYFRETSQPFVVETHGANSSEELVRLLQLHLIERLTLRPGVTDEELFQLCLLLHEDLSGTPQTAEEGNFDPESWAHIQLFFYSFRDTAVTISDGSSSAASGCASQSRNALVDLLADLPAERAEAVRSVLRDSALQEKLSLLRDSIRDQFSETGDGDSVDVVTDVFQELLREMASGESGGLDRDSALRALDNLISFTDHNLDLLGKELRSYDKGQEAPKVGNEIAQTLTQGPDVSENVRYLQVAKKRLASIFRTASPPQAMAGCVDDHATEDTPRPSPAPQAGEASSGPVARPESVDDSRTLQDQFNSLAYDLDELSTAAETNGELLQYFQIVLELLAQREHRGQVRSNWETIRTVLLDSDESQFFLRIALTELSVFVEHRDVPEFTELLVALLSKADPDSTLAWLEGVAAASDGPDALSCVLDVLSEEDRDEAVGLLVLMRGSENDSLKELARQRLVDLSRYPSLFSMWMTNDAESLADPEVLGALLATIGVEGVQRAFRAYFGHADATQAAGFLERLVPGLPGAEQIVFVAAESNQAPIRESAIERLGSFASPVAVKYLQEILKLNNYVLRPRLREVTSALRALHAMKSPEARTVLREVAGKREWLRHTYRKEIRRALEEVTRG